MSHQALSTESPALSPELAPHHSLSLKRPNSAESKMIEITELDLDAQPQQKPEAQDKKALFILPGSLPKPETCTDWVCRSEMRGCQYCWGNPEYVTSKRLCLCDAHSPETSQHVFDPFTFDHITTGMVQYALIPFRGSALSNSYIWFSVNFGLHLLWEIVENTPCFVQMFRMNEADQHYTGDSLVNSMGDLLAFAIGWWVSLFSVQYVHWAMYGGILVFLQFWALYYSAGLIPTTIRVFKSIFCVHTRVQDNRPSAPSDTSIRSLSVSGETEKGNQTDPDEQV